MYAGLAGLLIVREPWENAAGLPAGPYELPLVLQDRRVDSTNQFVYKGMMMMDEMSGVLGDTVMVNGKPDAHFKVEPRVYRLRIANISNARVYKLAWSDGEPMTLVGTDNGLLDSVQERPFLVLGPTERVEVIANFARRSGREVALVSRSFSAGGMGEMMHGMMGGGGMMGGMMGGGGMMGNGGMMHDMMSEGQGEELHLATFSIAREHARSGTSSRSARSLRSASRAEG